MAGKDGENADVWSRESADSVNTGSGPVAVRWRHARGMSTFLPFKGILNLFIILSSNHKKAYNLQAPADAYLFRPSRALSRLRTLSRFLPPPRFRLLNRHSKEKRIRAEMPSRWFARILIYPFSRKTLSDRWQIDKVITFPELLSNDSSKVTKFSIGPRAYGNRVEWIEGESEREQKWIAFVWVSVERVAVHAIRGGLELRQQSAHKQFKHSAAGGNLSVVKIACNENNENETETPAKDNKHYSLAAINTSANKFNEHPMGSRCPLMHFYFHSYTS